MSGETKLDQLLRTMQPRLNADCYTFCTVTTEPPQSLITAAVGWFREVEGVTLILPLAAAEAAQLTGDGLWAHITLSVHSDLHAVGFLARLSARLAQAGISVNVVSAFYHDHLFVPWDERERSLQLLVQLSADVL